MRFAKIERVDSSKAIQSRRALIRVLSPGSCESVVSHVFRLRLLIPPGGRDGRSYTDDDIVFSITHSSSPRRRSNYCRQRGRFNERITQHGIFRLYHCARPLMAYDLARDIYWSDRSKLPVSTESPPLRAIQPFPESITRLARN